MSCHNIHLNGITKRQQEITDLFDEGHSARTVARKLGLSLKYVQAVKSRTRPSNGCTFLQNIIKGSQALIQRIRKVETQKLQENNHA